MIEFVELFVVGIGVGAFGALVGIGGGMIMVPLFMFTMMVKLKEKIIHCNFAHMREKKEIFL